MDFNYIALAVVRWGPAIFFTVVAVFYTARILVFVRRQGRSPVGYGRPGTEQHRLYLTFRVFRVLIWLAAVARALWPPFDAWLVPIPVLASTPVMLVGNVIMIGAFGLVVAQHLAMGAAWRSGLPDPADRLPLLPQRPFGRCLHPMLATIMLAQLGLFLAIPSLFTTICLVVGVWTLVRQADLEERQSAQRHGTDWQAYRAGRRRWPWSRPAADERSGATTRDTGHGSVT